MTKPTVIQHASQLLNQSNYFSKTCRDLAKTLADPAYSGSEEAAHLKSLLLAQAEVLTMRLKPALQAVGATDQSRLAGPPPKAPMTHAGPPPKAPAVAGPPPKAPVVAGPPPKAPAVAGPPPKAPAIAGPPPKAPAVAGPPPKAPAVAGPPPKAPAVAGPPPKAPAIAGPPPKAPVISVKTKAKPISPVGPNNRQIPRYSKKFPLTYGLKGKPEHSFRGYSRDVGAMGLFIMANRMEKVGQHLTIEMRFPHQPPMHLEAEVIWTKWVPPALRMSESPGFGVKIVSAPEQWFEYFMKITA